ncbi:MAG: HDOD domain-containing protein [Pseudomonadota bacterium]
MTWHRWWGATQWAAYLEHMELPVKAATKATFNALVASRGDNLSPKELAQLMLEDALFALRLLKEANRRLPRRLGRDITTPLGAVLALGTTAYTEQLLNAPEVTDSNRGFAGCEARAALSARVAQAFASHHHDLDPGEVALAALLSNSGEIELWAFAPELPMAARDELDSGRARRSEQAQQQSCGFAFKELTLLLSERWQLPPLIVHLIRGDENLRAKLARLAVDTARHLSHGHDDPALPFDVNEAARLTGASLSAVVGALPGLDDPARAELLAASEAWRIEHGQNP